MRIAVVALLAVLSTAPPMAAADVLDEVAPGHWAYAAVDALMQRGLVYGYEAAAYRGPVPLTRAEMAGLTARAVRSVGDALRQRGARLEMLAQAPSAGRTEPRAPSAQPEPSSAATLEPPAVTREDLARIEKLLAEFRNELVTMGANVEKIGAEVASLRAVLEQTREQVAQAAEEVARHRISGYTQLRYTADGSTTPESEFAVRRARVTLSGPLSDRAAYRLHFDVPSQSEAGESTARLLEAYAALDLGAARLLAGQFALPFGWELFTSARDLEAPERALGVRRLLPDQRFERGLRLEGALGDGWQGWLSLVNGTGYRRSDTNDRKDLVLRLAHVEDSLEYGLSAYYGRDTQPAGDSTPRADADRRLLGAHLIARRGAAEFKGEVIGGTAATPDAIAQGDRDVLAWSVLGAYAVCPDTRLVLRFHRFDPDRDAAGNRTDVTSLVWMRQLDDAVRLRIAEEFVRPDAGSHYEIFTTELQIVY